MKHTEEHTNAHRPRVMIVIGTLAVGGGAEKVAAALGSELTTRGYETHLVTFYEDTLKFPYTGIYHSFNETLFGNRVAKLVRLPQRIWKLRQYARKNNIDLAISFLEEANFYTLLMKLCTYPKLPVVVSVRVNILRREWPFRVLSRLLYPFAVKVVSVTRAIERILERDFKLSNTTTIYNPLDLEMVNARSLESLPKEYEWLLKQSPLLISNGRYTHQKGQWHLIRAFSQVKRVHPSAVLAIIGSGELEESLRALIVACNLEGSVVLLGRHENVYPFLKAADVFVFSSLFEGMPNAMLEALALNLPLVSPDCVSGPRELLAPELDVSEPIEYPYETPIGTLTAPLSSEYIWESPERTPLTTEEAQLASSMLAALKKSSSERESGVYVKPFTPGAVFNEWEAMILAVASAKESARL